MPGKVLKSALFEEDGSTPLAIGGGVTSYNALTDKPTLGTAAAQDVGAFATAAQGTDARTPLTHAHAPADVTGTAVVTADTRLSDARPASDVSTWAKAGTKPSYTASEVGAAASNDARLSDARTPTTHSHSAADVTGTAVVTGDSRLSDARTPTSHSHAAADVTGTAVLTGDARLSDARTPTTHAHAAADITGTAVLTGDARLSDSRTASDVSAWAKEGTKPSYNAGEVGAEPAITGGTTAQFWRGDKTWQEPTGGTGLTHPQVLARVSMGA